MASNTAWPLLDDKKMKPFHLNQKGTSLQSVMLIIAMIAASTMATLTMMKSNLQEQRFNRIINTLNTNQLRYYNLIMDPESWEKTVNLNSTMNCLRANKPIGMICPPQTRLFDLYDANGSAAAPVVPPVFTSLNNNNPPAGVNGFRENGVPCATFSSGLNSGDDNCSIAYRFRWRPICPAPPCSDPDVEITVEAFYNPKKGPPINVNKYSDVNPPIIRNALGRTKSFQLKDEKPGSPMASAAGGACGASYTRRLSLVTAATDDPFDLVQSINAATGVITLRNPGNYRCRATAVGFAVGGFTIFLRNGATNLGIGTGFAPDWIQGNATLDATFNAPTAGFQIRLVQNCQKPPGGVPNADIFALGMPKSPYVPSGRNIYATLSCTKLN